MSVLIEGGGGTPIIDPAVQTVMPSTVEQKITPPVPYTAMSEVQVSGDTNLVPSNILSGTSIFGVDGVAYSFFAPAGGGVKGGRYIRYDDIDEQITEDNVRGVLIYTDILYGWSWQLVYININDSKEAIACLRGDSHNFTTSVNFGNDFDEGGVLLAINSGTHTLNIRVPRAALGYPPLELTFAANVNYHCIIIYKK